MKAQASRIEIFKPGRGTLLSFIFWACHVLSELSDYLMITPNEQSRVYNSQLATYMALWECLIKTIFVYLDDESTTYTTIGNTDTMCLVHMGLSLFPNSFAPKHWGLDYGMDLLTSSLQSKLEVVYLLDPDPGYPDVVKQFEDVLLSTLSTNTCLRCTDVHTLWAWSGAVFKVARQSSSVLSILGLSGCIFRVHTAVLLMITG